MQNLSAFDESWGIIAEPEDDSALDTAIIISGYKQDTISTLTVEASEVLYIYDRKTRRAFVETLLFIHADLTFIAKHTGMEENVIQLYGKIFFDVGKLRGSLGHTEYIEETKEFPRGTMENTFGRILAEATIGGREIVLDQFNIGVISDDLEEGKNMVARRALWDAEVERRYGGEFTLQDKLKLARDLLSIIRDSTTASSNVGASSIESLISVIKALNTPELENTTIALPLYNPATEEFIETTITELEEIENVDNE